MNFTWKPKGSVTTIRQPNTSKTLRKLSGLHSQMSTSPKTLLWTYGLPLDEVEPDFLEDSEIKKVLSKEITIDRLAQVRDIFIFCCYTGLAFSDVRGLYPEHIVYDNQNAAWIRKKRQKTTICATYLLLSIPLQIIKKYKDHPVCIARGTICLFFVIKKWTDIWRKSPIYVGMTANLHTHRKTYVWDIYACQWCFDWKCSQNARSFRY